MTLISTTIKLVKITPLITELAYRFPIIVVHQRISAHARNCVCAIHGLVFFFSLQYHSNNFYFKLAVPFFTTIPSVAFSHMARPSMVNMQSREKPFLTLGVVERGGGGGEERRWLGLFCQAVNFPQQIWTSSQP